MSNGDVRKHDEFTNELATDDLRLLDLELVANLPVWFPSSKQNFVEVHIPKDLWERLQSYFPKDHQHGS